MGTDNNVGFGSGVFPNAVRVVYQYRVIVSTDDGEDYIKDVYYEQEAQVWKFMQDIVNKGYWVEKSLVPPHRIHLIRYEEVEEIYEPSADAERPK